MQRLIVLSCRAYLSINPSIDQFPRAIPLLQSNSQLSTDRNTCNALNLKAQPSPPAVPTRRSSESNRTAQHIVHTSSRPQTVSPAESNRTAFPSCETGSPLFPSFLSFRPSSSPSARHFAQSTHYLGIPADYQRTVASLRQTSAISVCFLDLQPLPAQHRPVQPVSATSPSISPGRIPVSLPIFRQFPLFA